MTNENLSQEAVLRAYTALRLLREQWGGALLLSLGLEAEGAAVAMAANLAGAVCMAIEAEPSIARAALRNGSCDFVVNSLDEALRALKNEVRRHLPISVGLEGDRLSILAEMVERGVQPQVVALPQLQAPQLVDAEHGFIATLRQRGAVAVDLQGDSSIAGAVDAQASVNAMLRERQWELCSFEVGSSLLLKEFDTRAYAVIDDDLRRQWLRNASRIVQRQRPLRRLLWATAEEKALLAAETSAP